MTKLTLPNRFLIIKELMAIFLLFTFNYDVANAKAEKDILLNVGENHSYEIGAPIKRILIANSKIADVTFVQNQLLVITAKTVGSSSITLWLSNDKIELLKVLVKPEYTDIQEEVQHLFPNEHDIKWVPLKHELVLSGGVSTSLVKNKIDEILKHIDKIQVVDALVIQQEPQIMLSVKVLEVQKNHESKIGATLLGANKTNTLSGLGNFSSSSLGQITFIKGGITATIDAQLSHGDAKILAQPNIVSVNGKPASFMAGGKIFIPIPVATNLGVSSVSLQEENYGVGLKFTPNLITDKKVSLSVLTEVSELATSSTTYGTGNNLTTIPTIMSRKASTTLELIDGESFTLGGLLQNNISKAVNSFPFLGELPVIGVLFRSTDFQQNKTELVFIVTLHVIHSEGMVN